MSAKIPTYLEELRKAYQPYADFAGAELAKIESLAEQWEQTQDPVWLAFRDNPITKRLLKNALGTYKASKRTLANDDGKLEKDERLKLHLSAMWAAWYMKALGGNPEVIKEQVEAEIETFAGAMGIAVK